MYKVKLADIAEGLESGKIIEFLVKEGDQVTEGQDLFSVETDKVNAEVGAPVDGRIAKIHFKAGDEVRVGELVIDIDDGKGGDESVKPGTASPTAPAASVVGTIAVSDTLIPSPLTTPPKATPLAQKMAQDQGINLRGITGTGSNNIITTADLKPKTTPAVAVTEDSTGSSVHQPAPVTPAPSFVNNDIKATPFLRHQAAQSKVNLAHVRGTGPAGRILVQDLTNFINSQQAAPPPATTNAAPPNTLEKLITPTPLTGIRKAIARQMVLTKTKIPETTLMREVNITELVKLRASLKVEAAQQGVKLTFMAFFIRACCVALRQVAIVNSSLDEANNVINYKHFINIGIAVDTPAGLMVPVIANADQKSILKIAAEVVNLAKRARERKITLAEMQHGTFTISNYGSVGIEFATPVINYPEVAILGIGAIVKKPVLDQAGQVVAGSVIPLSLTIDHRVIDGADGARFLTVIINLLETPTKLLLV